MIKKKDIIELYEENGLEWSTDMFVVEPGNTKKILSELEDKYGYTTREVLSMSRVPEDMDEDTFHEWQLNFWKLLAYEGVQEEDKERYTMDMTVEKRNGTIVDFDSTKIANAISKANNETKEMSKEDIELVTNTVEYSLIGTEGSIGVEDVQDEVEEQLMNNGFPKTAKAYILYRDKQKRDIFKFRKNLKPYEYPELEEYKEAIQHSYWLHTEFNYTSDIQDFKVNVNDVERNAIKNAMLAIAQVEVAVKTFWGDLYHRMPKPELGSVGYTFAESECHVEGTEILTPEGWKDFRDVQEGDLVAQFHADNTIDYVPARNKVDDYYKGEVHELTKRSMHAVVTPNHKICYYRSKDAEEFELEESRNISGRNSSIFIPEAGRVKGSVDRLTDRERLLIAVQADGHKRFYRNRSGEVKPRGASEGKQAYSIIVKKDRKKERLEELLASEGIEYNKYIPEREGYVGYEFNLDTDYDYKTLDWVDLTDKSYKWAKEFIDEVLVWDGTVISDKKDLVGTIGMTDENSIDIIHAIGTLAGYRVTKGVYEDNRSEDFNTVYNLAFVKNRDRVTGTYNKEIKEYEGRIYCVEVDTGVIITRYNGRVFIGGNSRHHDAYAHLLDILGLNDEFEKIDQIPALRERVDYLTMGARYSKTEEDRDYALSVLLFSLFIEHVSLFSQFLIIMSFNKHKNLFKGMSNAIEATSKEEQIHGLFGIDLVNIIREEHPEWFDERMAEDVYEACRLSYESEEKVIDWIYEAGDLDFLPKHTVKEFVKHRLNNSLESVGYERIFEEDENAVDDTQWFNDEIIATKHVDFFVKRSVNYTKRSRSITSDDLF